MGCLCFDTQYAKFIFRTRSRSLVLQHSSYQPRMTQPPGNINLRFLLLAARRIGRPVMCSCNLPADADMLRVSKMLN